MPHCVLWGPAEWSYAIDSLVLAARFHQTAEPRFAAELRNREKVLGTTGDYLRALRIRYVEPEVKPRPVGEGGVSRIEEYAKL